MSTDHPITIQPRLAFTISISEALLLPLVIILGLVVIFSSNLDYAFNTILLLITTTVLGFIIAKKTSIALGEPKLKVLGLFWLFKVLATILLLYWGWMPDLDYNTSTSWGYDPQRYYQYSSDLISNDWEPNFGLNYMGIIYYYGAIFAAIGRNPLIPSLINIFVTLFGVLFLIRSLYAFIPARSKNDWRIVYLLLIPEVLWYDVITSRETLMAILILSVSLIIGRNIVAHKGVSTINSWLIACILTFAILSVRTTMIIPVAFGAILMFLILSKQSRRSVFRIFLILIAAFIAAFIVVVAAPMILDSLGTSTFDFSSQFARLLSAKENIASDIGGWSDRSIGLLLMPEGLLQALFFLPFRMILYLAAPLPNIAVTASGLLSGHYSDWQNLMTLPTSLLMMLLFPYILAGTSLAWRIRRQVPGALIIPITFWVNFAAVAAGNLIIHERYRLMFTLLFFASVWIGYTRCNTASIKRWAILWFGSIYSLFLFYSFYKII